MAKRTKKEQKSKAASEKLGTEEWRKEGEVSHQFLGFPTAVVGVEHEALLVKAFHQHYS